MERWHRVCKNCQRIISKIKAILCVFILCWINPSKLITTFLLEKLSDVSS